VVPFLVVLGTGLLNTYRKAGFGGNTALLQQRSRQRWWFTRDDLALLVKQLAEKPGFHG
jgi:hypothetical protein